MDKLTLTFLLHSGILISLLSVCAGVDTITLNQTIKDGDTIVSSGENYEMGFFSPGTSKNRYIGIWYKKISTCTVIWVANRETPLTNKSGVLKVGHNGLELLNSNKTVIWSTNTSESVTTSSLVAQLLDSGNLVVRDQGNLIWQSFDYPGDTLVSGMRISMDLLTGKDIQLTSWKNDDDPSAGPYVLRVEPYGYPQLLVFERQNLDQQSRFGPWNGVSFNGMPNLGEKTIFTHQFVVNEKEIYYKYELVNNSLISRMHLSPNGHIEYLNWIRSTQSWSAISTTPDICDNYASCGAYGVCNINDSPSCSCLKGFEPQRTEEWNIADFTSGCQRIKPLSCGNGDGDGFRNISGVKFPDTNNSWYNQSVTLGECELACKKNCSCTAYASLDIRNGGSGCLLWFKDLMDVRVLEETEVLYIRMPASELTRLPAQKQGSNKKKQTTIIVVSASLGSVLVCVTLAFYVAWRKNKRSRKLILGPAPACDDTIEGRMEDTELSSFSLSVIAKSTNNFSVNNKLGAGGFGPVYKGVLEDGLEIAVKRLSQTSTQGVDEFKNEVRLIAKLQHRNLVKLLGYCIQGNEKLLIYEYMANKSLDTFIFDNNYGSSMLDWPRRYCIIHGIARGLLYLHQDSRLRIIHRDMKASNILLDKDMNPKISDFGLARRFNGYETEANTSRVAGTYGYIPPEYALHGFYSVKSDVYSFGVLVLEIVTGKKNRGYSQEEHNDTLVGHAWRLYKEGRSLELVSASLKPSCVESQVLRSVHIGLLCVQHHAEDRPTMSSVVLMLGNEKALPPPKEPAFLAEEEMPELRSISSGPTVGSIDDVTITLLDAR